MYCIHSGARYCLVVLIISLLPAPTFAKGSVQVRFVQLGTGKVGLHTSQQVQCRHVGSCVALGNFVIVYTKLYILLTQFVESVFLYLGTVEFA